MSSIVIPTRSAASLVSVSILPGDRVDVDVELAELQRERPRHRS